MATFFRDRGTIADAIADTVQDFQTALGNPLNGNDVGPLTDGRRQIN